MPRQKRTVKGNVIYYVHNRANGQPGILRKADDFAAFERILAEGFNMRLTGYCLMSNHRHLLLWPRADGIAKAAAESGRWF
jgi:putative transposase